MSTGTPSRILPLIVISQFAGTSLWFAGNAVLSDIQNSLKLDEYALSHVTSAVQLGFITGTLLFALLTLADRFSPVRVFFLCCLAGAVFNASVIWFATDGLSLFILRFLTGFSLAGIYPVGMKIAADWHEKGLGKALGWLVGALVVGTAFPHLLKGGSLKFSWENVFLFTSGIAVVGGLLVFLFVPDGPYRKRSQEFNPRKIFEVFRSKDFRSAAFGYFGHMWELYTFWALVPSLIILSNPTDLNVPLLSFLIIASGGISCVVGGYIAQKTGSARVAFYSLLISFTCCAIAAFMLKQSPMVAIPFLVIWGITVISDSPQFSALVAQTALPEWRGTALTLVTSIGFAITIVSIQILTRLFVKGLDPWFCFIILSIGPLLGLIALYRITRR